MNIQYWNVDNKTTRLQTVLEGRSDFDVIVIQEPPRNRVTGTPSCRRNGHYEMIFYSGRVAFYVSKRIDKNNWLTDGGEDWAVITFGTGDSALTIISVYLEGYKTRGWYTPLSYLEGREYQGRTIIVGDFNVHYPM